MRAVGEVSACQQRAGTLRWARGREGCSDSPPPYLWTPPTPQPVAKGYSPLTILKKKSKHKKASAAPVGAIALTLFSLLHLKPLSRCATAPPRGSLLVLPKPLPPPLKAVPLRDDFPRSGGRCRVATKGGVWLDAKRQAGRGNIPHTKKLPLHREMQREFEFTGCYLFLYIS